MGSVHSIRYTVHRLHPALSNVLDHLEGTQRGEEIATGLTEVLANVQRAPALDHAAALRAHLWLLERANDGLPLTQAGYLRPADVKDLAALMPEVRPWSFPVTREVAVPPVLHFRSYLQDVKLLRKYKGKLLATRLGRTLAHDPVGLWRHLADTLVLDDGGFARDASVVILASTAMRPRAQLDHAALAGTLDEIGWQHRDGSPVDRWQVSAVTNDLWPALGNVGDAASTRMSERLASPEAVRLICDALYTEVPAPAG